MAHRVPVLSSPYTFPRQVVSGSVSPELGRTSPVEKTDFGGQKDREIRQVSSCLSSLLAFDESHGNRTRRLSQTKLRKLADFDTRKSSIFDPLDSIPEQVSPAAKLTDPRKIDVWVSPKAFQGAIFTAKIDRKESLKTIVKLPMLPFAVHSSYNHIQDFRRKYMEQVEIVPNAARHTNHKKNKSVFSSNPVLDVQEEARFPRL